MHIKLSGFYIQRGDGEASPLTSPPDIQASPCFKCACIPCSVVRLQNFPVGGYPCMAPLLCLELLHLTALLSQTKMSWIEHCIVILIGMHAMLHACSYLYLERQ